MSEPRVTRSQSKSQSQSKKSKELIDADFA